MQPPHQHSRINLADLKTQIAKKLGPEGSKQYFHYLNMFLSLKLGKPEFSKLCLRILGRDNIPLHNQLIRSILKNACSPKSSPPPAVSNKDVPSNNHQPNEPHISMAPPPPSGPPVLSNGGGGDMLLLPPSPKKARTGPRDRRSGDRRSPLGLLNGKAVMNGDLKPENENEILSPSVLRRCSDFSSMAASCSETIGQEPFLPRSPIRAPLGVSFCSDSSGGARPPFASKGRYTGSIFNGGLLSDSVALRERMEEIALGQGIQGVSMDSANLLNHGLDSYMKRLIRSCVELVGSRKGHELIKNSNNNNTNRHQHGHGKLVNGGIPGYQNFVQNSVKPLDCPISLEDFRVAMEMNPRKLGEDWPLLLEKICTSAFEE